MANGYYNHGNLPGDNTPGSSAEIRAEFDAVEAGFAKLPTLSGNAAKLVKVNAAETGLETQAADALVAATIHAATSKATPADADEIGIVDSAASNVLKKLTWTNLKTTLKAYFDPIYAAIAGSASQAFSTAALTVAGLLDISGASAGQIKFPATQNPSSNANTLDDYKEGTVTLTLTGCTTSPTIDVTYVKNGRIVTLHPASASVSGTSNSTSKTLTGLPSYLYPVATAPYLHSISSDNGGAVVNSAFRISSSTGVITIHPDILSSPWTASGTATWYPPVICYVAAA